MTTNSTINPERLERLMSAEFHLRHGAGNGINGEVDACLMQAVDWLSDGDGTSYRPACASSAITSYCILLNDSLLFREHRDLLKPYAAKIIGTRDGHDQERVFIAADYACRKFAPIILRADTEYRFDGAALALESIIPITDSITAKSARTTADMTRRAVYMAHTADGAVCPTYPTCAVHVTAVAARTARGADGGDWDADWAATNAAFAAQIGADTGDAHLCETIRSLALECLDAMCAVGRDSTIN